jgi:hypothetical protein
MVYGRDKPVSKMLVEYTQLLSTAAHESGFDAGYRTTHKNPHDMMIVRPRPNIPSLGIIKFRLA